MVSNLLRKTLASETVELFTVSPVMIMSSVFDITPEDYGALMR